MSNTIYLLTAGSRKTQAMTDLKTNLLHEAVGPIPTVFRGFEKMQIAIN